MNVYVSQGHEWGIGLEVFLKSCLFMCEEDLKKIRLIAFKDSLFKTLKHLKIPFEISSSHLLFGGQVIPLIIQKDLNFSKSFTSLKRAMEYCEQGGILFTLPTSKDQFPGYPGHTEFFRKYYNSPNLGMYFKSPNLQMLLISDHISLKKVSKNITEKIIFERIYQAVKSLNRWNFSVSRVLISGFNPHAGESGLIGNEDSRVNRSILKLRKNFSLEFNGPYPGDSQIFEKKSLNDLLVYIYHDQGLGVFKSLEGLIGANITLGLPFLRLSPDHGTSFNIFGNNVADYRGCAYALRTALNATKV